MMNYYGGWGMMGSPVIRVGWIIGLLFWIAVGILFILVVKSLIFRHGDRMGETEEGPKHTPGLEPPLEILKRRYAKGEITLKEFEKMKKDIQ